VKPERMGCRYMGPRAFSAPLRDRVPYAARGDGDRGFARTSGSRATGNLARYEDLPGEGIRRMLALLFRDARGSGDDGRDALKIRSRCIFPMLSVAVLYLT
jgi:hypothetical protein